MLERWNRDAADVEVRPEVEPEHGTPRRHRALIESRAFSKLATFDSKASSRNLYGHPLAGLLWERQFEKKPIEAWQGENSKLGMSLCTS